MDTRGQRRWAQDMRDEYTGTRHEPLALAVAAQIEAAADLQDITDHGAPQGMADSATITEEYPIIGRITISARGIQAIERPYNDDIIAACEAEGIYVAWQWCHDPASGLNNHRLCHIHIGTRDAGPVAGYDCNNNQWYTRTSRGNYGKRYACGGTWSAEKTSQKPKIVERIETIMDQAQKIKQAEARLQAANLRLRAAHTAQNAAAHISQAAHPSYDGQSDICVGKACVINAYTDKLLAEAALIEANAGL
jgi:hypothetical protein